MTRDDLEVVRKALELGGAMADYEAAQRVMDAGIAALSRLEAQQPKEPGCVRCGAPYLAHGQCSRHAQGCQGGRGEQPTPPECPARKALERIRPHLKHREDTAEVCYDWCPLCIAEAVLLTPCSSCQRCAEAERVKAEIIAEYIDDHGITCDCCQHVMIDVTAARESGRSHCTAGDPEGEGVGCGHSWHETAGKLEDERDALTRKVEELVEALRPFAIKGWGPMFQRAAALLVEHEKEQG